MSGKLVALVDGSDYSRSVCEHAAWLATRSGRSVELLHVIGRRSPAAADLSGALALGARSALLEELAELDARMSKLGQARGRAILEDAEAILRKAGVEQVSPRLRIGDLVEEVSAAVTAEGAPTDMLVIGKRGEAADFASGHLGSNLERVARVADRPVFVASRAFHEIGKVLVAFDGGPSCLKAVDHMSRSPTAQGLRFRLVRAGEDTPEARRGLEGARAMLAGAGIEAETEVIEGAPAAAISGEAERWGADLMVMGAYGHSRIRSMILGSATEELLRGCRIPVFLFR